MKDIFPLKVWAKNLGVRYTQQNTVAHLGLTTNPSGQVTVVSISQVNELRRREVH